VVVLEIPISRLCGTEEFFEFAYGILSRAGEFRKIFNSVLSDYRKEHHIRSKVNPFPDLAEADGFIETVFWKTEANERRPVWVKPETDGAFTIMIDGGRRIDGAGALMEECAKNSARIWPRAVALSLMGRVFISDLFVHGLGGAKYDLITDRLIPPLYGIKPPLYATASCTLPAVGMDDPAPKLEALRREMREMEFHPESFVEKTRDVLKALDKKDELIREIKRDGADKKKIGNEIREINNRLNELLASRKAELARRMESAEKELDRYTALTDRELPFFLYPPGLYERFMDM